VRFTNNVWLRFNNYESNIHSSESTVYACLKPKVLLSEKSRGVDYYVLCAAADEIWGLLLFVLLSMEVSSGISREKK
jgi:hypothetical protein